LGGWLAGGELDDVVPGDDEAVVSQGFLRPALALTGGVQAVAKVAGDFGAGAELGEQVGKALDRRSKSRPMILPVVTEL